MKNIYSTLTIVAVMFLAVFYVACNSDDDSGINPEKQYDQIQVNGEKLACCGYRSIISYSSTWNTTTHRGEIALPCSKITNVENGEYDYDNLYTICLDGESDLQKGSKLEDYYLTIESNESWSSLDFVGGSATVIDKGDNEYITIKFNALKFDDGKESYTLNGTVQLELDENS